VIGQVPSRLRLAVTDPLTEEPDSRLGITLANASLLAHCQAAGSRNHTELFSVISDVIGRTPLARRAGICIGTWLGALALVALLAACGSHGAIVAPSPARPSAAPGRAPIVDAPVQATPAQHAQIVAALDSPLGLAGFLGELQGLGQLYAAEVGRHIDYESLKLDVTSVRVSSLKPLLASAIVELLDHHAKPVLPAAIVVLSENSPAASRAFGPWTWVLGPAESFPGGCSPQVEISLRELLCPNPWIVLGSRPPAPISSGLRFTTPAGTTNIHSVDWADVSVPGSACGAAKLIRLHRGLAVTRSAVEPWWPAILVSGALMTYGQLAGREVAVVSIGCDNGGGTADGQLGSADVVYTLHGRVLSVIGVLTPRQPLSPRTPHVPLLYRVTIRNDQVITDEAWYGPNDGTADPSIRAVTFWKLSAGVLRPFRTIVTREPGR
jgi:hypothetical protein